MMSDTKFNIVVLDDFEELAASVPAYEKLKARAQVTILRERLDSAAKIELKLRNADCILLMRERTRLSAKEFNLLPRLRFIAQTGRTSAHLDLPNATLRCIAVAGTPSDNGTSTKELTVGLILALLRKIPHVDRRMREEIWPAIAGQLLEGKTIGIVGLGRIGKEVARIMKVFNTRILAYSRTLTVEKAGEVGAECVPMETLLKESDIITLHVPLNPHTRGIIGNETWRAVDQHVPRPARFGAGAHRRLAKRSPRRRSPRRVRYRAIADRAPIAPLRQRHPAVASGLRNSRSSSRAL